jgi:hypothetical protein
MEVLVVVAVAHRMPLLVARAIRHQRLHHKETMAVVGREDLLAAAEAVLVLLVQARQQVLVAIVLLVVLALAMLVAVGALEVMGKELGTAVPLLLILVQVARMVLLNLKQQAALAALASSLSDTPTLLALHLPQAPRRFTKQAGSGYTGLLVLVRLHSEVNYVSLRSIR